jgi:hypothetical protein
MSKRKPVKPVKPNRLTVRPPIKPLNPNAKLALYRVPDIPRGKFHDIPGQAAMDFERDEWDALTEPSS